MTRPRAERYEPGTTPGRATQKESWGPRAVGPTNQLGMTAVLGSGERLPDRPTGPPNTPPPPREPPEIMQQFPHVKIFANVIEYLRIQYGNVIDSEVLDLLYKKVEQDPRGERAHLWQIEGYLLSALEQKTIKGNRELRDQIRMYIRATSWFSHPRFSQEELRDRLKSFAAYHAAQYDSRRPDPEEYETLKEKLQEITQIQSALTSNTLGKDLLPHIELLEKWIAQARREMDAPILKSTDDVWGILNSTLFDEETRPKKLFHLPKTPKAQATIIRVSAENLLKLRPVRDELLFRYLYPETMRSVI
ncbi:hypothetical protein FJZ48_00290 [Candidatus Uhrbacteria bacterium]|nr:hypothetical protein [Candidatus Uhrbacteria bacterium]